MVELRSTSSNAARAACDSSANGLVMTMRSTADPVHLQVLDDVAQILGRPEHRVLLHDAAAVLHAAVDDAGDADLLGATFRHGAQKQLGEALSPQEQNGFLVGGDHRRRRGRRQALRMAQALGHPHTDEREDHQQRLNNRQGARHPIETAGEEAERQSPQDNDDDAANEAEILRQRTEAPDGPIDAEGEGDGNGHEGGEADIRQERQKRCGEVSKLSRRARASSVATQMSTTSINNSKLRRSMDQLREPRRLIW